LHQIVYSQNVHVVLGPSPKRKEKKKEKNLKVWCTIHKQLMESTIVTHDQWTTLCICINWGSSSPLIYPNPYDPKFTKQHPHHPPTPDGFSLLI
jgi:hypothetical protein